MLCTTEHHRFACVCLCVSAFDVGAAVIMHTHHVLCWIQFDIIFYVYNKHFFFFFCFNVSVAFRLDPITVTYYTPLCMNFFLFPSSIIISILRRLHFGFRCRMKKELKKKNVSRMWIVELCALFTHSQSTCNVTIVANDTNNKSVQPEKKKMRYRFRMIYIQKRVRFIVKYTVQGHKKIWVEKKDWIILY